jgi:hypothetical protein
MYRGKDILFWLDAIRFFTSFVDASTERDSPGPQIIGTPLHADLDLSILQSRGVQLVGHASGVKHSDGGKTTMTFENDLHETISVADAKLSMLLTKIGEYISQHEIDALSSARLDPVPIPFHPLTELDLNDIRTLIWATGYVRNYPLLLASPPNYSRQRWRCSAQSWRDARERNLYFRYAVRNDAFFQLY